MTTTTGASAGLGVVECCGNDAVEHRAHREAAGLALGCAETVGEPDPDVYRPGRVVDDHRLHMRFAPESNSARSRLDSAWPASPQAAVTVAIVSAYPTAGKRQPQVWTSSAVSSIRVSGAS